MKHRAFCGGTGASPVPKKTRARRPCYFVAAILVLVTIVKAQTTPMPGVLKDVGIDQKLNAQLPLDLHFRDEAGGDVQLRGFFGKRPVILTLVYYKCPGLCTLVLNDLTRAMKVMKQSAGENFDVVTVSFDARETPDLAAEKKHHYLQDYHRPNAAAGWHFLTGDEASIKQLTSTVGFRYAFDPKSDQYAHAGGIVVLTPTGKISRYFFGIDYSAKDLGNALVDASAETIGASAPAKTILYCFQYDPTTGKYSLIVTRALRVGAVATMLALFGFVFIMLRRDRQAARQLGPLT